ncbi:hypothetical protein [Microbacterium capsulatum]|uniref:Uncharacterized protein n=1 Tax=Microbacterium capsulatum TaxID=3041921 RepID=A0ABU0XIV9_9MICO|nr:hypothetical protein [Microbacterium sp. ASV81]MDQ4215056.1 hypothetical protein [Microbacterium sp. ASV81]
MDWPAVIDVGAGWFPLLIRLDGQLAEIAPDYELHQCKSKFGALSFYAQPSDDPSIYNEEFVEAIRAAEWESTRTCEECGEPAGQYVIGLWVWTLCAKHAAEKNAQSEGGHPAGR